jgi:hypothetical protein
MSGFLNRGCAIQDFWKTRSDACQRAPVTHDSHSKLKKACVKLSACVKSVFPTAWNKELEKSCPAQAAKITQTF